MIFIETFIFKIFYFQNFLVSYYNYKWTSHMFRVLLQLFFWNYLFVDFVCFVLLPFGHAKQHVGFQLPNQELNLGPLQWKCRVLTLYCQGSLRTLIIRLMTSNNGYLLLATQLYLLIPEIVNQVLTHLFCIFKKTQVNRDYKFLSKFT